MHRIVFQTDCQIPTVKYVQVIVPVPLPATFTYAVPERWVDVVAPMFRVVVQFGSRKVYTAIVTEVLKTLPADTKGVIKEFLWCADTKPVLRRPQLQLWNWMADYYMCAIGDVMKAALPAGLKIESETIVEVQDEGMRIASIKFGTNTGESEMPVPDSQLLPIYEYIKSKGKVSVTELEREGYKNVMKSVYELMDAGAVIVKEKLTERFRPKTEEHYIVTLDRENPESMAEAMKKLRSPRHQKLLMILLQLSDFARRSLPLKTVSREALKESECYDRSILQSFVKKGIIRIETRVVSRFRWDGRPLKPLPVLSDAQKTAFNEIHDKFAVNPVVLLHGVTSSGKTEIYMHLMDFMLRQGKQVLMLVPEIALTTQLTGRLQNVFGSKVVIYHSRFSDAERVEIWNRLLHSSEPMIVIGARSSVFLPFASLGLVIVDEEHEPSYKQFDPAPRYNARDVAIVLSRLHGAKTLLASATPSIETYYKAQTGHFGLVELKERYGKVTLPDIEVVDMAKARLKGDVHESLAGRTVELAKDALGRKEQVIIFHNRRGFSPLARCKGCEYVPRCNDCDVSLTYHKRINRLVCHYCGREYPMPEICPSCKLPTVHVVGYGTERIEDNVAESFPGSRILRMDLDTTRNKENYAGIIDDFSHHKADILVGTQMVTKGLDFGNVSTVVTTNADMLINYPDFRSGERAFNMLEQVAGRAGRREDISGRVIIQTRLPEHPVIRFVLNHDYEGFYAHELAERQSYNYPPFTRIIYVYVRHRDPKICAEAAETLAKTLKIGLGNRILGPHEPPVARVKSMYMRRIMVKIEPSVSIRQVKSILTDAVKSVWGMPAFRSAAFHFDVDPS